MIYIWGILANGDCGCLFPPGDGLIVGVVPSPYGDCVGVFASKSSWTLLDGLSVGESLGSFVIVGSVVGSNVGLFVGSKVGGNVPMVVNDDVGYPDG